MPQMYINRLVWKQEKVQIYEVDKKMDFFRELKNKMEILSIKKKTNQFSKDYKVSSIQIFISLHQFYRKSKTL